MADERHDNSGTGAGGHLPPWLRGVPLPARPSAEPSITAETAAAAPTPTGALPDWLRELQDPVAEPETDEAPPETLSGSESLPNWLATLQSDSTSAPVTPPASDDSGIPDWLREVSADPATSQPQDEPPAPPIESPRSTKPPTRSPLQMPSGATDWLRSLGEERDPDQSPASAPPPAPEPPVAPSEDDGIPSWLRTINSAEIERDLADVDADTSQAGGNQNTEHGEGDSDIPSWLAPDTGAARESVDSDIPEWLRSAAAPPSFDTSDDDPRSPVDQPSVEARPVDQDGRPEPPDADLPDWLRTATSETSARIYPVDDDDDRGDVEPPAWLRSSDADEPPVMPPPAFSDEPSSVREEAALPAWLRGDEASDPPRSSETADDLPAWLRGDEASQPLSPTAPDDRATQEMPAWLRGDDPPAPSSTPPSPPANQNEDIPAWLRGDEASQPLSPTAVDDRATQEMPAWLRGDDPPAPSSAPPSPPSPPANQEEDIPAWLRGDEPPASSNTLPSPPANQDEDIPAWLRGDDSPAPSSTPPSPPANQDADIPAWLRMDDVGQSSGPSAPSAPVGNQADQGADDLPDWLRMDQPAPSEPVQPADAFSGSEARPPVSPLPDDEPDWLHAQPDRSPAPSRDDDMPDWLRSDSGSATSDRVPVPPPRDDSLPDWLQGDDVGTSERNGGLPSWLHGADTEVPRRPEPSEPPAAPGSPLPPWLRDEERPTVVERDEARSSGAGGDFLGLGGADLPTWLRGSDAPPPSETASVAAPGETYTDWLARLRTQQDEEADGDAAFAEPTGEFPALKRPTYVVKPERAEAIALLNRLVAEPFPTAAPLPATEVAPARRRFGLERVLYLLLLLALVVGLVMPELTLPLGGQIAAPGVDQLIQTVDSLGENDIVLVAYEWDVRRRGEMAPLELSVMNHLAQRNVKFVFVSTDLQGTLLTYDARDRLVSPPFNYQPRGIDYILLGYKPGGELALRRLAQNLPSVLASDFSGADANQSAVALDVATGEPRLTSVRDFAMVVVMADDAQDVQSWMEQVRPEMDATRPLAFLMPTETTPIVQPYLRMDGVFALSGRQSALVYDQRRAGEAGAATAPMLAQIPFTVVSFIALVVLGSLVSALVAAVQRRRSR